MKLSDITELHLVAVVAGATFLGGIGSSLLGALLVGADTERQTDVQIVQVAIGILSDTDPTGSNSPEAILRAWAVDTINSVSEVKLDHQARDLLVSGETGFPVADQRALNALRRFHEEGLITPEAAEVLGRSRKDLLRLFEQLSAE